MKPAAHILLTRPTGQHTALADACVQRGLLVSHLPCLAIETIESDYLEVDPAKISDTVLFTSSNAVINAHALRALPWPNVKAHAIGAATALALESYGQFLDLKPQSPYTSESYVRQLYNRSASSLLIVKGEGGRNVVRQQLNDLGWQVNSVDVYRRTMPIVEPSKINKLFTQCVPDIISIYSNETLTNLMTLTKEHQKTVLNLPLLVNSHRCAELASSLSFLYPARVAKPAGDTGQLQQLEQWLAQKCRAHTDQDTVR